MATFSHSKFIPVSLRKITRKKFGTAIFGYSKFIPVFLGKIIRKNSEWPFLANLIFSDNFPVYITLIQCNGLESNKNSLNCQKKNSMKKTTMDKIFVLEIFQSSEIFWSS